MSCEACQEMQNAENVTPHEWLLATGNASKLRPLRRQPVVLQRYRCTKCDANWVRERDPLNPVQDSWICLYHASSILDPVSLSHQTTEASVLTRSAEPENYAVGSTAFTHRFT